MHQPAPGRDELIATVEAVSEAYHPTPDKSDQDGAEPPDDDAPIHRATAALVADAAGLVAAAVGQFVGWAPGSAEAASLVTFVDTQPKLRGMVERALGVPEPTRPSP